MTNNINESCDNVNISMLERIIDKLDDTGYYGLLCFEKETIDFVIDKYAYMSFETLKTLVLNESLYKNINISDKVKFEKLNDIFIQKTKIEDMDSAIKLKKFK